MERDSRVTKDDEEQDDEEDANIFGTKARRKQQQQQQQNQQQQNQQQSGGELGSIGEGSVHSVGSGKKSPVGLEGANGTLFPPAAAGAGAGGSKKKFPLMFPPTATTPVVNSIQNAAVPVTPSSAHLGSPSSSTSSSSFHMLLDSSFSSNFGQSHKMKSGKGEHVCQVLWDALRDNTGLSILNGIDITNNEEVEFSKHLRSYEVRTHIYI
jgi:hypothetical protein